MARGNSRQSTVRGEYASGEGWKAGEVAPADKYVDLDGKVSDSEPKGGGRLLVAKGDVVRPHMEAAIRDGSAPVAGRAVDNENSPGDSSHGRRRRQPAADDGDS